MLKKILLIMLIVCVMLTSATFTAMAQTKFIAISAGSSGGTFYPVCTIVASIFEKELGDETGYKFSVQSSVGTGDNLERIRNKEVAMCIADAVVASQAYTGDGNYVDRAIKNMRFITSLYAQTFTYLYRTGLGIEKIADFKGRKIAVGAAGGAEATSTPIILKQVGGLTYDDISPQYLGDSHAAMAIQDRLVDASVHGGGIPIASVAQVFASKTPVAIMEFTDEDIAKIQEVAPYYTSIIVPKGMYAEDQEEVQVTGTMTSFIVEKDLDEDIVYKMLEVLYLKKLDEIKKGHGALQVLRIDRALGGLTGAPLHPGAVKFYRDNGIEVPDTLIPPEMK